jgi:UDP-N-acetylmuramyl pentapeptide phosphotransferase/UDP-N-acetylglucosamine-1-phosphate transferase
METSIPTVKTSLLSGGLRLGVRRVGMLLATIAVKVEQEFVRVIVAVVFFVLEAVLLLDERLIGRYLVRRQPAKVTRHVR